MLIVLGVCSVPFLVALGWFYMQLEEPFSSPGDAVTIRIQEGWGTDDVGQVLADKGVIGSTLAFRAWTTIAGAPSFQEGVYEIPRGLGIRGALATLAGAPMGEPDVKVTFRPGLRLDEIAAKVGELEGKSAERFLELANSGTIRSKYQPEFVTSLEGLLFPDTYFIGANESEESILTRLVARFDEVADEAGLGAAAAPYDVVRVAALIQTEAKLAEDAPLISAVIANRLRDGMLLQIDATLCYAKGGCPPVPTVADKAIASPYNTYRFPGLPPTPIASVTKASLEAALAPADVDFLFYVLSDANGKHAFATTLAEHNRNVAAARAKGLL